MKKLILAFSLVLVALVSCSSEEDPQPTVGETKQASVDATSKTSWVYYSLAENKLVGTGEESEDENAKWFARTDWDLAISRYSIRTNSGAATSVNAKGGVYCCASSLMFSSIKGLPMNINFVADKEVTSKGMGGVVTTVKSEATVIVFKTNEDGSKIMPPVYLQAPVYIFRTADGEKYFKVEFTQYLNEEKESGHVKFNLAQIK